MKYDTQSCTHTHIRHAIVLSTTITSTQYGSLAKKLHNIIYVFVGTPKLCSFRTFFPTRTHIGNNNMHFFTLLAYNRIAAQFEAKVRRNLYCRVSPLMSLFLRLVSPLIFNKLKVTIRTGIKVTLSILREASKMELCCAGVQCSAHHRLKMQKKK